MTVSVLKLVMFWVFSPYTSSIAVCDTSTLSALFLLGIILLLLFLFIYIIFYFFFWWRSKYKYPHRFIQIFFFRKTDLSDTHYHFQIYMRSGHKAQLSYNYLFCRLSHNKLFGTVCLSIVEFCPTEMPSLFHNVVLELTTWHWLLSSQLEGLAERIYQLQLATQDLCK